MVWKLLLALSLACLGPQPDKPFQGRVITESGTPVQGASVLLVRKGAPDLEAGNLVATDETGAFRFKKTPEAVFVQKTGFAPVLYHMHGNVQAPLIVMRPVSAAAKTELPSCANAGDQKPLLALGPLYKIPLQELQVQRTGPVDASLIELSHAAEENPENMTVSWGEGILLGYPKIDALARTNEITVNSLRDIQGITDEGKHWRWAFFGGVHFQYYDASPEAAELFDDAINGICRASNN